jgi:N-acetylmuramoyl-L-alanine amidase
MAGRGGVAGGGGGGGGADLGGGGAGASIVTTVNGSPIVVAGGGGGGGGNAAGTGVGGTGGNAAAGGGAGGSAGSPGGVGGAGGSDGASTNSGGGGGTAVAGSGPAGGSAGGVGGIGNGTIGGGGGAAGASTANPADVGAPGTAGGTGAGAAGGSGTGGAGGPGTSTGGNGGLSGGAGGGGGAGGVGFGGGGGGAESGGGGGGAGHGAGGGGAVDGGGGGGSSFVGVGATTTTSGVSALIGTGQVVISYNSATDACPGPLASVLGKTIVVDAGHNGANRLYPNIINQLVFIGTKFITCDTTGTGSRGLTESAYNLDVALRLQAVLQSAGARVVMTRTNDNGVGPCINERAAIGNRAHADVGISIHADGGPTGGRGFHVIFPQYIRGLTDGIYANSVRLAYDVRAAYAAFTPMPFATYIGTRNGLSERNDLGGLNLSQVPKVFIETGNMKNATDINLLLSPVFRQQAAGAIAFALAAYLAGH